MSVKTAAQISAEILTNVSDPLLKQNTPAKLRQVLDDLNDSMFNGKTLEATLTIPTASILTLNSIPLQIVSAPGAGKYISILSASACMETYAGTPYATNTILMLICDTATLRVASSSILVSIVVNNLPFALVTGGGATDTQMPANKALNVSVLTGDPTAGNSNIKVKVLYNIITI
jgi:hypothetical protein